MQTEELVEHGDIRPGNRVWFRISQLRSGIVKKIVRVDENVYVHLIEENIGHFRCLHVNQVSKAKPKRGQQIS